MLQSLLQPREYANRAVAVRHDRRRAEKRGRRLSQLGRPGDPEAPASPERHRFRNELYGLIKVAALHAVVIAMLLGIVLTVVGVVQLSPGAEAAHHRFYLMGGGAALLGSGIVAAIIRYLCLHWLDRKMQQEYEEEVAQATQRSEERHGHEKTGQQHTSRLTQFEAEKQAKKPKLKSQASVGCDVDVLIKQPSTASDT